MTGSRAFFGGLGGHLALPLRIGLILVSILRHAIEAPIACLERMRRRRQLAALSDGMLKDIGASRADIEREVGKPFWRE